MMTPEQLKELGDEIAATEALIDQAQAHLEANRHHLTEDEIWNTQANLDIKRFQLEIAKMQAKMMETLLGL